MITAPVAREAVFGAASRTLANRSALVFTAVFYSMVAGILATLWSVAAEASGGTLAGYSTVALVWYVITTEATVVSLPIRLIDDVGIDIVSGRVTDELLRPASSLWVRIAIEFGAMLPRLAVCGAVGFALATIVGGPPLNAVALLLAIPSLLLALVLNLMAQHAFAAATFWIRDARSTWFLYQKLVFIVGGMLIPLEVLPSWLETTARLLPFSAMAYIPARLASGNVEPHLLLIQVGWIAVIGVIAHRVFRAGERHLVRVGG